MDSLFKNFLYIHGFFVFLLYFIGNFFTIIILEYRLQNKNLKHTLAAFGCIALSGVMAYHIPVFLLGTKHSPLLLQFAAVLVASVAQAGFWFFWFKKRFRLFLPALAIAFVLSVIVTLILYNAFMGYIGALIKAG